MKNRVVLMALLSAAAVLQGCAGGDRAEVAMPAPEQATQTEQSASANASNLTRQGHGALAEGRFAEADRYFTAAATADPTYKPARLGLALARLGQGRRDDAAALLQPLRDEAVGDAGQDADLGLALALAGLSDDAVAVLEARVAKAGDDRRARQNLAFAYGMAGDWTRAEATARLDLAPSDAAQRITDWQGLAALEPNERLAGFLGVTLPGGAVQSTEVADATASQPEVTAQLTDGVTAVPEPVNATPAAAEPVASVAQASSAQSTVQSTAPKGPWVIQLAAFADAGKLEDMRSVLQAKHGALLGGLDLRAQAPRFSADYYRLVIDGFASRDEAAVACDRLRSSGLDCFVRKDGVQVASKAKPKRKLVAKKAKSAPTSLAAAKPATGAQQAKAAPRSAPAGKPAAGKAAPAA